VAQALVALVSRTPWVPRPSRFLRRAGTTNDWATGFIQAITRPVLEGIAAHPSKIAKGGVSSVMMPLQKRVGQPALRYYKPRSHKGRSTFVVHLIPLPAEVISPAVSTLIRSFVISSFVNSGGKPLSGSVVLPEAPGDAKPWF
jgi:hypothetical protein